MANPIIDRPLRTLDFPASSRVSPLGFGFARQSGLSTSSPFKGSSGNAGSSYDWTAQSPLAISRRPVSPRRPRNSQELSSPPPPTLKRTRRSSSVSSSSTTVSVRPTNDPLAGDADRPIDVHGLALKERSRESLAPPRHVKRTRNVSVNPGINDDELPVVDVGLLLTAIPPTDHLSILLSLLRDDPSLSAKIIGRLPHPDLGECERQMDKLLDAVKRAAGPVTFTGTSQRAWTRADKDILAFHRTAHTYLTFFNASPPGRSPPDLPTRHVLLRIITERTLSILPLVPSPLSDPIPANQYRLLEFAKELIADWRAWLKDAGAEINERGEMFPHSTITSWAESLDRLAGSCSGSAWTLPQPRSFATSASTSHPLVSDFRSTMSSIRDEFVARVGWTIGRT